MNTNLGLIGRKVGMTHIFDEDGNQVACTVLELGPCTVTQKRTMETDGYSAIQIGFGERKEKHTTKAMKGHFDKAGVTPQRQLIELRLEDGGESSYEAGQVLKVADIFETGQKVDATGTSKGRGFAGVMKRHNFAGFIRTHGTHEFFRHGGSIGTRLTPGMVQKGMKMPGHMGNERVTVQNLRLVKLDTDRNLVYVAGGVPGPNGGTVLLRHAVK